MACGSRGQPGISSCTSSVMPYVSPTRRPRTIMKRGGESQLSVTLRSEEIHVCEIWNPGTARRDARETRPFVAPRRERSASPAPRADFRLWPSDDLEAADTHPDV